MSAKPVVRVLPLQPHCFAFGGFEVQMLCAITAAQAAGADIRQLNPWERDASFEVLHLWGFDISHYASAYWAHLTGKKVVVSALFPYPSLGSMVRHHVSLILGPARIRAKLIPWISALTVCNLQQAEYATKVIGIPRRKVHVIPNIIEDEFFDIDRHEQRAPTGFCGYVLCTGNICRRKNQLSLVKACAQLDVPVVLIGSVLAGEELYGAQVASAVAQYHKARWINGLQHRSPELLGAYRAAAVYALPSYMEQQPIAALEAAAARLPLVLGDRAYAKQEFYSNARLANPESVESIAEAVRDALRRPDLYTTPSAILKTCRRRIVGEGYCRVYSYV